MNWFGRKPAAAAARPALARGLGGSAAGAWPTSYEAQVRAGYCENPVVQRAVRLVVETLAGAPLQGDAGLIALFSAPVGGRPVIETAAAQLLLHGNAFVAVLRDADSGVAGLFPLRPERVSVELDALGWAAGYRYRVSGRETRFAAQDVKPELIHLRGFSPVDDHYGTGCLGAASAAVAIHNAADRWNKALLDNAARPSGALVYEPGDGAALSAEQFRRLADLRGGRRCRHGDGGADRGRAGAAGRGDGGADPGWLLGLRRCGTRRSGAAGRRQRRVVRAGAGWAGAA